MSDSVKKNKITWVSLLNAIIQQLLRPSRHWV